MLGPLPVTRRAPPQLPERSDMNANRRLLVLVLLTSLLMTVPVAFAAPAQESPYDCERYLEIFGRGVTAVGADGKTYRCIWTGWETRWRWTEAKTNPRPLDCSGYGTNTIAYNGNDLYYCSTQLRWVKPSYYVVFRPNSGSVDVWGGKLYRADYSDNYWEYFSIKADLPGGSTGFSFHKDPINMNQWHPFQVDSNHAVVIWPEGDWLKVGLINW